MKAIIIEDNINWCTKLQIMLDTMDITVVGIAHTVVQAIELLNATTPDIILADIMLDNELVFEVFESNTNFCDIPTLFLTASEKDEHFEAAKKVKTRFYGVKPLHQFTLHNIINTLHTNHLKN
jgi:DNA-binding NarL/FixJ family response regulator